MIDWGEVARCLDADGEFKVAARAWSATIRLDIGEESHAIRVHDGRLESVTACDPGSASDVFITAPRATWEAMLAQTPRPFYQDLFAAQLHHGVVMNADFLDYAAYYPALRRLMEILRAVRGEC